MCSTQVMTPMPMIEPAPQATEDAAKMANLNVLRLIKEPVAAAIAYRRAHWPAAVSHGVLQHDCSRR